jgi:hypothetical protein
MIRMVLVTAIGVLASGWFQSPSGEWHSISGEGKTQISLPNGSGTGASVVLETVRISRSNALFPTGDSFNGLTEAVLVKALTITAGQEPVFVWRSVFADLVNPTRAILTRDGSNFILRVGCRDGAEAFIAELHFNRTSVTRRLVFGTLSPREPSEDTRYRLREMAQ